MTSRSEALDIIEVWIASAAAKKLTRHLAEFWTVRDILEGVLKVSPARKSKAVEFVKNCKASPQRDALLKAMEVEK